MVWMKQILEIKSDSEVSDKKKFPIIHMKITLLSLLKDNRIKDNMTKPCYGTKLSQLVQFMAKYHDKHVYLQDTGSMEE